MAKKENQILSTGRAVNYMVGIFGVQLFIGYVNSFQTEFYNKMYSGFDSNIFYASAVIIFAAKLISCVADPIIGALIDRSNFKGGKIRPWILFSAFPIAILTTVIFLYIPFDAIGGGSGKILLYGYITLTSVLWNIAMSFADIPSQGMLSRLTPNVQERNSAAALSNIGRAGAQVMPSIFVTVVMLVLNAVKGAGYPAREYYLATALLFFVMGTSCYLLIYFRNREAVKDTPPAAISMKDMFTELKENKEIRIVFLIYMLGFARTMTPIVFVQANGALIGKILLFGSEMDTTADATWLPGLLGGLAGFVGVTLVPLINKRLGEKKTYLLFSFASFITAMTSCTIYWSLPADSPFRYGNSALYMIMPMQILSSICISSNTFIPLIMTTDIVDYREWTTGQRKEGVNFAILSMAIKLSNALCVVVGLLLVAVSGYTYTVYETGSIPISTQNIMFYAFLGCTGTGALLSTFPMMKYKIDAKVKEAMRQSKDSVTEPLVTVE